MTYSRRQLIPIPTSIRHPKYGLYKFIDERDPRSHHKAMLKDWFQAVHNDSSNNNNNNNNNKKGGNDFQRITNVYFENLHSQTASAAAAATAAATTTGNLTVINNNDRHCPSSLSANYTNNNIVTVLYVPGHWGSYMQSRSIGAHGIRLTGRRSPPQQVEEVLQRLKQQGYSKTKTTTTATTSASNDSGRSKERDFVFDVYSIDFREEGGAWHAQFLLEQSAYVAQAIQDLVQVCGLSQIVLLGHSMGGLVSRLTPIRHARVRPFIQNIVTLGTPHAHAVFGWESTVHQLYQQYLKPPPQQQQKQQQHDDNNDNYLPRHTLVAISGGLRDEMIPPVACDATGIPHSLSVLAPTIMQSGSNDVQPHLGMDHRAIVWCHNLLSVVRSIIFTLMHPHEEDSQLGNAVAPAVRRNLVKELLGLSDVEVVDLSTTTDFSVALKQHRSRFLKHYGFGRAIALECSMLYHLEILVGMFVLIGCFKSAGIGCLLNIDNGWMLEGLLLGVTTCIAARTGYQIHPVALFILSLVANSVLTLLQFLFGWLIPQLILPKEVSNWNDQVIRIRSVTIGCFVFLLGFQWIFTIGDWQTRFCLAFLGAVYIGIINAAIVVWGNATRREERARLLFLAADGHQEGYRWLAFASTFALVLPFITLGKIIAVISRDSLPLTTDDSRITSLGFRASSGLWWLVLQVVLPVGLRLVRTHLLLQSSNIEVFLVEKMSQADKAKAKATLIIILLLAQGPSLFEIGQSYRAGHLVATVSWIELFYSIARK